MEITKEIAEKVLSTVNAGLVAGMGVPEPGKMCVEAAVCYAMGLPHDDNPSCVSPALRSLKIALNDANWSSPQERAYGLRRLALAQLGSAGVLDEQEFSKRVALMTIQQIVPKALRAVAKMDPEIPEFQVLETAALSCAGSCDLSAAMSAAMSAASAACAAESAARSAASAAMIAESAARSAAASAASAARSAARSAASAAIIAESAARSAASAASAARSAASAAMIAESAASAARSAASAARDAELAFFAEQVVQILIAMDAPGCQWLDLAPVK